MAITQQLLARLQQKAGHLVASVEIKRQCVVAVVSANDLKALSLICRDDDDLKFECLMDIAGVDFSTYGQDEWLTDASETGFSRGVEKTTPVANHWSVQGRFALVYQLLSIKHNHRLMLVCFAHGEPPVVDSLVDVWPSANWNEREVFDMYGILFADHPDLRRILTDYGFIGHPFRKDFPLSGEVEVRYDATAGRVVYEPVQIEPRVLVPRVIRREEREMAEGKGEQSNV